MIPPIFVGKKSTWSISKAWILTNTLTICMFKLFLKVTTYNDAVRMLIEMATCKRRAEAEVCPFWTGIATSAPQQKPCRNRYGDEGCRHSQIYPHTGLHTDLDTCATSKCIVDVDSNKKSPSMQHACARMNIIKKIVTSPYIYTLRSLE